MGTLHVIDIQREVAAHYRLKLEDMTSLSRVRCIARPRQAAMWLCREMTTRSYPDIGKRFGGRDHTTAIHAKRKIDDLRSTDLTLQLDLDTLRAKLSSTV